MCTLSLEFLKGTITFLKDDFTPKFKCVRTGVNYINESNQFSDALKNEELTKIKEDKKLEIGNGTKSSYKDLFGSVASVGQSYFSGDDFGKILSILYDEKQKKFILNVNNITRIENYFSDKKKDKKEQKKNNKNLKRYATPYAATCRLLMALFPNIFCPIPTPNKVDYLIDKLTNDNFLKKDSINKLRNDCKGWLIKWCVFNNILYQIFNDKADDNGVSPWEAIVRYGREEQRKEIVSLLKENHNIILTGAPGTGKTYRAKEIAVEMAKTNTNLQNLSSDVEEAFIELQKQGYVDFVQFHPSYDYTDFVEGLRPNNDANGFERRDGIFKTFCAKAANDANKDNKYVIIIDEINRGEISKIFGELFFSIDPGYRGEKGKVVTQYQNLIKNDEKMPDDPSKEYPFINGFYVPEKVFIIGTMNDIDRSVESMDFAFRRRFAFKEIKAEDSKAMLWDGDNYQVLEDVMDRVNNELIKPQYGLSEAYQIGASYFNDIKKKKDSNNCDYKKELEDLWNFHIKGLVFEYLRGKPNAMELLKLLEKAYRGKETNPIEGQEEGEKAENEDDTQG